MFTSISRFCGAEVVTTFVSICQGIRRPRGRGSNIKTRRAKTRPAAGPGRRGGRRGTRGITNGISRERSSPDGCTMYAFGLRRAAIPGTGDRVREPSPVRTERRAGRGHAPDRADSGRLREAASRACGDGVTPHCTYGGTARRARRDLLCAPCGLNSIWSPRTRLGSHRTVPHTL